MTAPYVPMPAVPTHNFKKHSVTKSIVKIALAGAATAAVMTVLLKNVPTE